MLLDVAKLPREGEAFDVVVIGAGGAGMSAALFAAIDGARVLLVERTEYVGGTTAYSGGTTWIPGTRHAASVSKGDTLENAETYLQRAIGDRTPRSVAQGVPRTRPRRRRSRRSQFRSEVPRLSAAPGLP